MTDKDKEDLERYRAKERGELIDNCYRARLIPNYDKCTLSVDQLRSLYGKWMDKQQDIAWGRT